MGTDYNPIAERYQRSRQQPWRTFIECFALMGLIGDPEGLSVLDPACGEGYYTRLIRHRGAARVRVVGPRELVHGGRELFRFLLVRAYPVGSSEMVI